MILTAPRRTFVLSRYVDGDSPWRLERVIEAGETVDTTDIMALSLRDPRPMDWAIAEETGSVGHAR